MKRIKHNLKNLKGNYRLFMCALLFICSCRNNGSVTVSEYLESAHKKDATIINDTVVVINPDKDKVMIFDSEKWITLYKVPTVAFLPNDNTDACKGRRIYKNNCFPCHVKIPEKDGIEIVFKNKFYSFRSISIEKLDNTIELSDRGKPTFVGTEYMIKHGVHDYYWTISKSNKVLLINYLKTIYSDSIEPCNDTYVVP